MSDKLKFSNLKTEIIKAIEELGPIPFAHFMEICLYSPHGGFYSTRQLPISQNFTTSSHTHEEFGGLLAVQVEEMWRILGMPSAFYLLEIGCGDGSLARSIQRSVQNNFPEFSRCLIYIASDLAPRFSATTTLRNTKPDERITDMDKKIQRVVAEGMNGFRNITGCIFSNELIDNFPVHRVTKINGSIQEIFTGFDGNDFIDVVGNPSNSEILRRLKPFARNLENNFKGEVNIRIDQWSQNVEKALTKGFILTIDYGEAREIIYSPRFANGTITCFRKHFVNNDPYSFIGEQDITSHVDFTFLQSSGEKYGLKTIGFLSQTEFLENLGFNKLLEQLGSVEGLSEAQVQLRHTAMSSLIDPTQMGNFKVLIQGKGINSNTVLLGQKGKH